MRVWSRFPAGEAQSPSGGLEDIPSFAPDRGLPVPRGAGVWPPCDSWRRDVVNPLVDRGTHEHC